MAKMVVPIDELSEKEINVLFSGFDEGSLKNILSDSELTKSLEEKGYLCSGENIDLSIEGIQNTNKYWYDRCAIILDELQMNDDMEIVYSKVVSRISISKHLFYMFIDNLVSIGKITSISKYITK